MVSERPRTLYLQTGIVSGPRDSFFSLFLRRHGITCISFVLVPIPLHLLFLLFFLSLSLFSFHIPSFSTNETCYPALTFFGFLLPIPKEIDRLVGEQNMKTLPLTPDISVRVNGWLSFRPPSLSISCLFFFFFFFCLLTAILPRRPRRCWFIPFTRSPTVYFNVGCTRRPRIYTNFRTHSARILNI